MPFVRCKFYSESGEPVKGGCHRRDTGCSFVHPDDLNWSNAPAPSFRPKDKSGDSGFKSWGERGKRGATASAWNTGEDAGASTADNGSGWGTGGGWDTGGGWGMGVSAPTSNQASEPKDPFVAKSTGTARANKRSQSGATPITSGNTKNGEEGWGTAGSGWGSNANEERGGSSWGEDKDTDKDTDSGWGWDDLPNDGRGIGWGNDKDVPTWGSERKGKWGSGWGDNATSPKGSSDPMAIDNLVEKKTEQKKRKGKSVPAPPRIRIPRNENKKTKITGTNNEPLGSSSKWGEPRSANLIAPTPISISTPITAFTPIDSLRSKRKRDVAFDEKSNILKEYMKAWERTVRTRVLLAEAEAKRDRWFRTQKSACYARIGEAGRKKLDGQRAECDKEVNMQKEKLSSAITSLVDFHDTVLSSLDLCQRYDIGEEMEKFITESKAFVNEVRALLVERVLRDRNKAPLGDAQKLPSIADDASVDSWQGVVRDLDERFEQAQTELTLCHQRDIRSEVDEHLTAKIADLRAARQKDIDRVASLPRSEIVIPPSSLKNVEGTAQRVRELDAKVPHIVEDIRVLLLRVDATAKRVSALEEELSTDKETHRKQMQEMAAEKEATNRRVEERLADAWKQYEQLVASQPCEPGTQPDVLRDAHGSQDKLVEHLRPAFEAMLEGFYEREIRPTITSTQRAVIATLDHHLDEAIGVLWTQIQPAMNVVAGVSRWLDSQELGLTAPTIKGTDS